MKRRVKINILSVVGLTVLLLLSPCKVRNFIQAELGIPQTHVLNKSQSTVAQTPCQTFENSDLAQVTAPSTFQHPDIPFSDGYRFEPAIDALIRQSFVPTLSKGQQASAIPLYILYQNRKVYS